jgi:Taurine catabolism dioxygenase TauD, TfdA family
MVRDNFPATIDLGALAPDEFISYFQENKKNIDMLLCDAGAVKFRGVHVGGVENFKKILDSTSEKFISYIDGNSPRKKLSENIYTSTEYDKTRKITMHNELSFSRHWPKKLYFFCVTPAESGGETLIADSRVILNSMDKNIVNEIERRGVRYIRNLHGGLGFGRSWQDTFETDDKTQFERYCDHYCIERIWKQDGSVTVLEQSKGIIEHRVTRQKVWFNQIDQFHPYQLGAEVYEAFKLGYESHMEYPIYVTYGDGGVIDDEVIAEVLKTIDSVTIAPKWQENELLIMDNELASHGRNPFTGERSVLVGMSE